jgi:hypothetical protein
MNTLDRISHAIFTIRGEKVMLDVDLAQLYGVTTKRLNEQVKRNRGRFPEEFMLRLTPDEKAEVVAKRDHLHRLKFSPSLPNAFTEYGALMLASVLNSPIAIQASITIIRVFVRLREAVTSDKSLRHRLKALEKKFDLHDAQIKEIFDAIHALMEPPPGVAKRRIGFRPLPEKEDE